MLGILKSLQQEKVLDKFFLDGMLPVGAPHLMYLTTMELVKPGEFIDLLETEPLLFLLQKIHLSYYL